MRSVRCLLFPAKNDSSAGAELAKVPKSSVEPNPKRVSQSGSPLELRKSTAGRASRSENDSCFSSGPDCSSLMVES